MNQLKAGAVLNYIVILLNTLVGLLYTPYMLRMMGQSEYGLYSLVASVIAYLTILDLGLGNAVVRYTAKYRAEGKQTEQYEMFGMFFILYIIIGAIALIAGSALYFNVDAMFGDTMTALELDKARIMMLLLVFNLAFTFPMSIFGSIITAYERFVFPRVVNIIRITLNTAVMICLLHMGYKAIAMVVVQTVFNVLTLILNYIYCRKELKIKMYFRKFKWGFLKEVAIYSFWIFLNVIMDRIYWSTGQFVLGAMVGTAAVAVFAVAIQLQHLYMQCSTAVSSVFLPKVTSMVTTSNDKVAISNVTNYLDTINLLDVPQDNFSMAYALGAFSNGVSPYNLASAYSMIANKGVYQKGYTIKKIINASTNEILYTHEDEKIKVLSTSTSDILTSILENVVENNYYGLGSLKLDGIPLYLKSGTSSFDSSLAKELNYPSNASKDLWIAGFSKQYSFAIWSGFDYPIKGKMNYFKAGSDARKTLHKQILAQILELACTEKGEIEVTNEVTPVYIVRGTKLLPNNYIPTSMIVKAYFKKGDEPLETISIPALTPINNIEMFFYENSIDISFSDYSLIDITKKENTIYSTTKIYGEIEYVIELNGITHTSLTPDFQINNKPQIYNELVAYTRYSKVQDITSNKYITNFTNLY